MNIKKIFLLITLFLISLSSLNAVTSLTSCGKNSGWVDGETYTLDFTIIPDSNVNNYCFLMPSTTNNIIFEGNGQTIENQDLGLIGFLRGNSYINSFTLQNINFVDTTGISQGLFYEVASNYYGFDSAIIDNVETYGFERFYHQSSNGRFQNSLITDSKFIGIDVFAYRQTASRQGQLMGNSIQNSIIELNDFGFGTGSFEFEFIVSDSVLYKNDGGLISNLITGNLNTYTSSLIGGYTNVDSNDDNIADAPLDVKFVGSKISLQLDGYNFIQDFNEGIDNYNTHLDNNLTNVYLNNEILLDTYVGTYFTNPNGESSEFLGTLILEKNNNLVINGGVNCNLFSSNNCLIQEDVLFSSVSANKFRGLLNVGGGTIEGITLSKVGSSNSNLISNLNDVYSNGLIIQNNIFNKHDDRVDDDQNELLNLKANNLLIQNNDLTMLYTSGQSYEFLDIESTTPNNNIVTENNFNQDSVIIKVDQQIFNDDADTKFYNNYLGENIVLSNVAKPNLNINSLIPIEYLGNIYYFEIGNYYEDNTFCLDLDSNGVCDSSYTSGAITDNFPLSSYPYNYLSNLGNAVSVVAIDSFNISLNILENQTFYLTDLTNDLINISFNHNSNFPDLVCSYILDGASILDISNVENTIEHDILLNDWIEKSYSYRVECLNDFIFQSSTEISFNVELQEDNGGDTGGENNETSITTDIQFGVFTGDVSEDADSINSAYEAISTPMSYLLFIGLVFMALAIIGLVIAVARYMVR